MVGANAMNLAQGVAGPQAQLNVSVGPNHAIVAKPSSVCKRSPMTFLPIVQRELRVAARKRSTPWLRVLAALIAIFIGTGFLAVSTAAGTGTVSLGRGLFGTLTWLGLLTTLAAGLFFTA